MKYLKIAVFVVCIVFALSWTGEKNKALAFVVDHTNLYLFDQIPSEYITAAKNLRMVWGDRSVGGNIDEGLNCLAAGSDEAAVNSCKRNHTDPLYVSPASELNWSTPQLTRANWSFRFDPGLGVPSEYTCPGYTTGQFDWIGCFINFARANINNYDVVSYQHSYLAVMPGQDNIISPTVGYFVDRANGSDIYDFDRMVTDFPNKTFFYWTTSLSRGIGTQLATDYNNSMRNFVQSRGRVLFDVADIESHDPWGNPCYDNRDGVYYAASATNFENHPDDGLNIPAICQHYTGETEGGHLGNVSVGKIRLAKAYWITMAYIAGWRPSGGTTPPPPPSDTQVPTAPSSLTASSISSTQINLSWSASTDNVGVSGYRVERCTGASCTNFSQIVSVSGTIHSDTGLTASTVYRYQVRAVDAAGNFSGYSNIVSATTQSSTDTVSPAVSVSAPISGSIVSGTVNVTANATDNVGVVGVQFRVDGMNVGNEDTLSPYTYSWNTTTYPNANNTITAVARDASGNTTISSAVTVTINNSVTTPPPPPPSTDTTPPTASVSYPTAGSTVSGTVTITVDAADNVRVGGVLITVDGIMIGTVDTTAPYTATWNTTTYTNSTHSIRASVIDSSNNTTNTSIVSVVVNNSSTPTPPPPSPTPSPTPAPSTRFTMGERIQTTANVNVRSTASASGALLGTQSLGSLGTIVSGGTSVDGFYWWNVNYDSGADGYSVEDYLTAYITPTPNPIPTTYTLSISKTGTGSGTVSGTGINCGSDCSETLNSGTSITLSASGATGSTFTGWSGGGCSGTSTCTVTLSTNTTVTATFNTITITPTPLPPPSPVTTIGEDWPTAAANIQRTSNSSASVTTVSGVQWYRPIEAFISGSTQIITSGGKIYVATSKGLIVMDAENGNLVCRFDTELPINTPTVDGGVVYFGGMDRKLYAINASNCSTVWSFVAGAGFRGNPLVTGGRVYIGNNDGKFYAINASNGSQAWSYTTGGPVMESAAYDAGILYFASMDMYGYALNASNGSLVWRTPQKLNGDKYTTWWPVVFGNYVIWSGSSGYKLGGNPGDQNAPIPGLSYDVFFGNSGGTPTSYYAGTFVGNSDGSHGWPVGSAVMSTTQTTTNPYTISSWVQTMPAGRPYTIVNKSNGAEPFYFPAILAGENGDGQAHPPATDGTALYLNNVYQDSAIPRSAIFAWKDSSTWIRRLSPASFAIDEPLIISMAGGRTYINLCCDRAGSRVDVMNSQQFWSYSTMLDDQLPSSGEVNAYDPMWTCYNGETFLERLGCVFNGNGVSRNGVINSHGMQNPLVPHAFTNASGQRVERMFTHRSNTIIAIGPTASEISLPRIYTNTNPSNTGTTLTSTEISQRLENEVQKMVSLYLANGTNGFLNPAYLQSSGLGAQQAFPESSTQDYFRLPADTVYTLASAYPYLSNSLKANVLSYLNAYWTKYFVTNRVFQIGYNGGTNRTDMVIPPEVLSRMSQISDSTTASPTGTHQRTFYAAWKYAQLVPSQALSIYNTVRPMLVYPPSTSLNIVQNPAIYNDYIAGYQGFLNLYDLVGTNPDPTLRANVANSLASLINTRLTSFSKDHPWLGSVDNPTGIRINNYTRTTNCMRNFMYMTPELGSAMRNSAQFSAINGALNEYYQTCPHWFMTRDHNTFQEASTRPIYDTPALFQAKAYMAGASQSELSKWLDVPWMLGDLYHMQNLVATLQAGGALPPPPPPPSDTTPPTVSVTVPANGATVSGSSVVVSANATDNTGVLGVQFLVDGANLGSEDTLAPYSVNWNTTQATNVSHTITARARDFAGNQTTSSVINVTVNNTTVPFILTIAKNGTGSGTVSTSSGSGINCGTDCNETVSSGTSMTIIATAQAGSVFAGWSGGGCSGVVNTCTVVVSVDTTVTATFNTTSTTPPPSGLFTVGQRVQTTANLNVRATASATGGLFGTQTSGALGTIVSGPVSADGFIWWNVNYDSGVDGWSVENYLSAYTSTTPPPPTPPTPTPVPGGSLQIYGITGSASVPRYDKQEISFNISGGSATNFNLPYDPGAPAGVPGTVGITVNAQFSQNNFATFNTIPAFYYQNFDYQTKSGRDWIAPTGEFSWKVRFAPPTVGTWQYRIVATDASGSVTSPVQTFSVTSSANKGFIKVSTSDSRYFEFEDGTPFVGSGYNGGVNWFEINPITSANSRLQTMGQNGVELARTWLSQASIFGSSWNPWYGMRGDYGGYVPRTGLTPLGGKMTLRMSYAESGGNRNTGYFEACRFMGGFTSGTAIKRNTNYKFKVSYRGFNISGPRDTSFPNYGLVLKMQNPANGNWHTNCYDAGSSNSTGVVISPYGGNNSSFTTLEGEWNSGSNDFLPMFYMALENVNNTSPVAGVYIESVEIKEQLPDGTLVGPNIVSKPSMEHQLYFDQKNSFVFDKIIDQAKTHGVYLKPVVLEKDDDILGTLDASGNFGSFSPANFYGSYRNVTASRWLQQAWWRYMQARWGYSSNIHSWELVNEGDPISDRHYTLADEFGKYIRQFTPNQHLVTTSFWHSLPVTNFWRSASYPNVDYADLHAYVSTSQVGDFNISSAKDAVVRARCGTDNTCFKNNMKNDAALYRSEHSLQAKDRNIGKPLVRGEGGLDQPTQQIEDSNLTRDTNGVWLHNFIWSGLDSGGMYDLYWWTNNIYGRPGPDGSTANGLQELYAPYKDFLSGVPLNNGLYQNIGATVSDSSNVRVLGQKDITNKRAHAWIQNRKHTWCAVVGSVSTCPYTWDNSRLSGTVTISGFNPNTTYSLDYWYFSNTGSVTRPAVTGIVSDSSGNVVLNLDLLPSTVVDVAVKIGNYTGGVITPTPVPSPVPPPTSPTPTPTPTPEPTPPPPSPTPAPSTMFVVGQRVQTTANVNVRGTANTGGALLGTQSIGSLGTVVGGPIAQGGFNWWNVNYDNGADGWSVENYLVAYTTPTPPPTPTPTPPSPVPPPLSSGGGGSGGGGITPTPTPVPTPSPVTPTTPSTPIVPTPTPTPISSPTSTSGGSGLSLTRTLYVGTKGSDVVSLQNYLISTGYLKEGSNSGYYGPLTKQAVQKYQCDRMQICSGLENTTGYGMVGQRTRESLSSAKTTTVVVPTSSTLSTEQRAQIQQQINDLLLIVQQLLIKLKEIQG